MSNRIAKLHPESFFFTDAPQSLTQNTNQSFGPMLGNEINQYRTTSLFSVSGTVNANAICTGQVFLQPNNSDNSKINLILRPYKQPINGLSVKFFIYRGLEKSDFLQSDSSKLIGHSNIANASEFINVIWQQLKEFNDWDDNTANSQDFLSKWVGYDPASQANDDLIDKFFFKQSSFDAANSEINGFELPLISKGTQLGSFTNSFGIDIVLSDGDYFPVNSNYGYFFNLGFARHQENIIDINNKPNDFAEKQYKEIVNKFIDPSAYYGLHCKDNGKVWLSQSNNTDPLLKTGQAIYNDLMAPFMTKNNVYIYVQEHLGRTLNYFSLYDNYLSPNKILKLGDSESTMSDMAYGHFNWPQIVYNENQNHTNDFNLICVQLGIRESEKALLWLELGDFYEQANSFLLPDDLNKNKDVEFDGYTKTIKFQVNNIIQNGNSENISSLIKLNYKGSQLTIPDEENETNLLIKDIDTLFGPLFIDQVISDKIDKSIKWSYSNTSKAIHRKIAGKSLPVVAKTLSIEDYLIYLNVDNGQSTQKRFLFESQIMDVGSNGINYLGKRNEGFMSAGSLPLGNTVGNNYLSLQNGTIEIRPFEGISEWINGIQIEKTSQNQVLNFYLGITYEEYESFLLNNNLNTLINASFYFREVGEDNNDRSFFCYSLEVIGEDSNGDLVIIKPESSVNVYSLDNIIFYSAMFSKYMISTKLSAKSMDFSLSI